MEAVAPLFFGLFFCLVVVIIIFSIIKSFQRKKEMRDYAASKGLRYYGGYHYDLDNRFPNLSCLRHGHSRYGYNLIMGDYKGYPVCLFDYHYKTGSGKHQSTHNFSAVILDTELPLQPLQIREEGFFDKVGAFVGFDDIDFESKEFSDRFFIQSPDKKWAYDVIHQKTMDYLMFAPQFNIEFHESNISVYRSTTFSMQDFDNGLEVILTLLDLFPDYLMQELKGRK